jgi:DNA-binding IclR family transcriptional regulator
MQKPPSVNVLAKAAQVLKVCHRRGGGLSLGDISRELGLPRSTVQRIVQTLIGEGLLASGGAARSISLGPELLAMGAMAALDIVERTQPLLRVLASKTGETVDLSRLNRDHAVFVNQVPGNHRLQAVSSVGQTFPLHCTANGKAILALLEDEKVKQFLRRPLPALTSRTMTAAADIFSTVNAVRRHGVAIDQEEHTHGICAIGMAFQAPTRQIYAVSIPVPTVRFSAVREQCEGLLRQAVQEIIVTIAAPAPRAA